MRDRKGISYTYPTRYDQWVNGLFGGNGIMGVTVFGNPLNETVIYNHRRFNIAAVKERTFKTVSAETLDAIRDACVAEDWQTANALANASGWKDGGEGHRHPGYLMSAAIPKGGDITGYVRENDYTTGEISVKWTDSRGDWERNTFVSRSDNVIVQYLPAPTEGKLHCVVKVEINDGMHFPSGMTFTDNSAEDFLNMRVLYPNPAATGNAGYEGVTRVIANGGDVKYEDGALAVTNADSLLLLTRIERYDNNCQTEWNKFRLRTYLDKLPDDYGTLLDRQKASHTEIYNRVSFDLNAPAADRAKSNEQLLAWQKNSCIPILALYERMFDAGRYHYLCSAGNLGPPDLLGIWTGDCAVGWGGFYHLDANLNLQISGAIVGNILETMEGYFYLNEAWVPGERENAKRLLGCRGLVTPGNTPGASSGLISSIGGEADAYYPYQYVTGGMAWLLQPFWEYYQVTGDKEFLLNRMYPILREACILYEDFLRVKDEHGKWIFAGSISPENAPSSVKSASGKPLSLVNNSAYDIAGARFVLKTMLNVCDILDIDKKPGGSYEIWQSILEGLPSYIINNDGALAEWAWPGLANSNAYTHRHSSGLVGVWPYRDITKEDTPELYDAARVFLSKKDTGCFENAGHGIAHAALIAAKLNNADSVSRKLLRLAKDDFYYDGLATAHYPSQGSTNNYGVFCTDVANTIPAIMMEMLMSSDDERLELLPALPTTIPAGTVTGLRARNRLTVDEITWDIPNKSVKAVVTSAINRTITLIERAGIKSVTATGAEVFHSTLGSHARQITVKKGKTAVLIIELM